MRILSPSRRAFLLGLSLAAACGGRVIVDTSGGTTGGASSATGGGGVSSTNSGGPATTSSGTTDEPCGGKQGFPCAAHEWCQWDQPGACGNADGTGTCQPRPADCPADCPGVCGCDGSFYCNACVAHTAGVDTAAPGVDCGGLEDAGAPDAYSAFSIATDVPRYAIFKAEHAADRCVQVIMVMGGGGVSGIQTAMGWVVEKIVISPHASDCALDGGGYPMTPPMAVAADLGAGSITQDNANFPCVVGVHVKVGFPSSPWAPPTDTLDADGLFVQGAGCGV